MRAVGEQHWRQVNPSTMRLVKATDDVFGVDVSSCTVKCLEENVSYEAVLEVANAHGWSPSSASSHFDASVYETPREFKRARYSPSEAEACSYFCACKEFAQSLPDVVQAFFDYEKHAICYCHMCIATRRDTLLCTRGGMHYVLPTSWVRIALKGGGAQAEALGAFDWHVGFHTTDSHKLPSILGTGRLVRAGDTVAVRGGGALKVGIKAEHIQQPFTRINLHSGEQELFDPNQIFLSPSIRYCELPAYAQFATFCSRDGRQWLAQVAFQVRLRPGSYCIGQQTVTVGACPPIDPYISNNSIEWYTSGVEHGSHIITGLLIRLVPFSP